MPERIEAPLVRVVIAVHRREVKTALFLAFNGLSSVNVVATAGSTAELVSYCQAFRPDVVIVEHDLPGRSVVEAIDRLSDSMSNGRVLVIDGGDAAEIARSHPNTELFEGLDQTIDAVLSQDPARRRDDA